MAPRPKSQGSWIQIIRTVGTPLGFYVLSLLIVETMLGLVLIGASSLIRELQWMMIISMVVMFFAVFATVTYFTSANPRHLVFGKEEHLTPQLDDSALRDQIEDIIAESVKPECLKNHQS